MPNFTPTEQRILTLLSDGMPHPRNELGACIEDELANTLGALAVALHKLRKKLNPIGEHIVTELSKGIHYRHVRLLASACTG